ncbi:hypothetical protein NM208_g2153 [Fusarium decemcellulare]|uniref:Uncharacterized protein n=1 Tax=Fusarium decemcellulare TaxID=57161 RepID=A0ACC1STM4_9HYPO|nr:hypothetical protein NM208_g2153 [Fusarium decemcellulare]
MTSTSNSPPLVPPDAWDNHIHVFEPDKHPYSPKRSYTPAGASLDSYPHKATGCANIVIVQATVQGTSPIPLVDVLARYHQTVQASGGILRGLTVLDLNETTDEELDKLHAVGIRGIRMHEVSWGFGDQTTDDAVANKIRSAATRLSRLDWVIDLYMHPKAWKAIAPTIEALPESTKIVADHWAGFRPGDETSPEFQTFLELVRQRRIFVKLSAFERQYHGNPNGASAMEPLARALVAAGSDRLIYGSDWPNTALASSRDGKKKEQRLNEVEGFRNVDHGLHINHLREWITDEENWRKFWVETPSILFK